MGFYDGKNIYRKNNEPAFDFEGTLREPYEKGVDENGNYCENWYENLSSYDGKDDSDYDDDSGSK